jgi:DNA-binding NarL/FixJ family response regulator
MNGLMLCRDLLFASKALGAASALGARVRVARDVEGLLTLARESPPGGVLIDLHHPGLDLAVLLASLREACPAMPHTVAFGSHVDAELLRAAREAGCALVLPRSAFSERLATDLPQWLEPRPGPG